MLPEPVNITVVYWLLFYAQIAILPKAPSQNRAMMTVCWLVRVPAVEKKLATLRKGAASN